MTAVTIGYAVKDRNGEIDPKSVYDTARGCKVNNLMCSGVFVGVGCSDEQIFEFWTGFARDTGRSVIMVEIREKERADG